MLVALGRRPMRLAALSVAIGLLSLVAVVRIASAAAPIEHKTFTQTCQNMTVKVGVATPCQVLVEDLSGTPTPPTGTVRFVGHRHDSFTGNPCTLAAVSQDESRCTVMYTATAVGTSPRTITGYYSSDPTHAASNGKTQITVTPAGGGS